VKKVIIASMALLLVGMVIWALKAAPEENSRDAGNGTASEVTSTALSPELTMRQKANKWLREQLGHQPYNPKIDTLGIEQIVKLNIPSDGSWSTMVDLHGYEFDLPTFTPGMEMEFTNTDTKKDYFKVEGPKLMKLFGPLDWKEVPKGVGAFNVAIGLRIRKANSNMTQFVLKRTYRGNEAEIVLPPEISERIVVTQ
jgi:hypothetical protein